MKRILINSVFAKKGGALTYIQNVVAGLRKVLPADFEIIVLRTKTEDAAKYEVEGVKYINNDELSVQGAQAVSNPLKRLLFDQITLPKIIRKEKIDVLFSAGNFGVLRCPCKQILLVRNTVFFDDLYINRVQSSKVKWFYRLQKLLTIRSMKASDIVLFPSQAMYSLVAPQVRMSKKNWQVSHYGSRPDLFFPSNEKKESGVVKFFHSGFYSDQKNLSVLLEAAKILDEKYHLKFKLEITAGFNQDWLGQSVFFPNFTKERQLYFQLKEKGLAEDLDWMSYADLAMKYRTCDIFIFPSYTESFGHPLIEAMHSALPVLASDTEVNRELCGDAGMYFSTFDAKDCAEKMYRLSQDEQLQKIMAQQGITRAAEFTWEKHAEVLKNCIDELCKNQK
ncbi:MAG: glycosyltransferase family 4 protein [Flavobacteriales bacterium]